MSIRFLDKYFGRSGNRMFQSFYLYAQAKDGNLSDWYLQDCKYFDKYKPELQMMFGEKKEDDRVSVHIRRAGNPSNFDEPAYSENPFYVDLSKTNYYQKAMDMFPKEKFLIFSDDIQWCMENFMPNGDYTFSTKETEEEDFRAMANCKGHIIANSSFSYMAAYLGGGKTIYPFNWFADGIQRVGFPSDWIGL